MSTRNAHVSSRPRSRAGRHLILLAVICAPYAVIALHAEGPVRRQVEMIGTSLVAKPQPFVIRAPGSGLKVMVTDDWAMPGSARLAVAALPEGQS